MAHLGTVPIRGVLSQRVGLEVCDGGHRLDVMKKSVASIKFPVFTQTSLCGGIPGLENRETWGTPGFPRSTSKDNSRYTRAGDVGHPPCQPGKAWRSIAARSEINWLEPALGGSGSAPGTFALRLGEAVGV